MPCYAARAATLAAPELPAIITYPRDAILERSDVARALRVSEEKVDQMDLPCFYISKRPRFVWGVVFDELVRRSSRDAAAELPHRAPTVTPKRKRA